MASLLSTLAISLTAMAITTETAGSPVEITNGATIALVVAQPVPTRATLVIQGVHVAPGASPMYQVALKDVHGKLASVGIINFFSESAPHAPKGTSWRFDAAAALRALSGKAVAVVIEPVSGVTGVAPAVALGSRVTIERVELISR